MANLFDQHMQCRPELGLLRGELLQLLHRLLGLTVLAELVVGKVVTVGQRLAHGGVEVDLLGDRMLDQGHHDLLGEQLHLLVGSTVHLLELREDVVYFPVLLGEERDYVSRCGGCRHVGGCTRPPAQRNEMPGVQASSGINPSRPSALVNTPAFGAAPVRRASARSRPVRRFESASVGGRIAAR